MSDSSFIDDHIDIKRLCDAVDVVGYIKLCRFVLYMSQLFCFIAIDMTLCIDKRALVSASCIYHIGSVCTSECALMNFSCFSC